MLQTPRTFDCLSWIAVSGLLLSAVHTSASGVPATLADDVSIHPTVVLPKELVVPIDQWPEPGIDVPDDPRIPKTALPGPVIRLIDPQQPYNVRLPFRFEVEFEANDGIAVDPETFSMVVSGPMNLFSRDVTELLREHAIVFSANRIVADVDVESRPRRGRFKVTIEVADIQGRRTSQTLTVTLI